MFHQYERNYGQALELHIIQIHIPKRLSLLQSEVLWLAKPHSSHNSFLLHSFVEWFLSPQKLHPGFREEFLLGFTSWYWWWAASLFTFIYFFSGFLSSPPSSIEFIVLGLSLLIDLHGFFLWLALTFMASRWAARSQVDEAPPSWSSPVSSHLGIISTPLITSTTCLVSLMASLIVEFLFILILSSIISSPALNILLDIVSGIRAARATPPTPSFESFSTFPSSPLRGRIHHLPHNLGIWFGGELGLGLWKDLRKYPMNLEMYLKLEGQSVGLGLPSPIWFGWMSTSGRIPTQPLPKLTPIHDVVVCCGIWINAQNTLPN